MSAALDLALIVALLLTGALALRALPWTDAEILAVHRAAVALGRAVARPDLRGAARRRSV